MERPIVLCGLGRMGARVLEYLRAAHLPAVVIDTVCKPDDPRLAGAKLVSGDCRRREVLVAAGVAEARGVLILTNDDLLNVTTALTVRGLNRDVRIVLRMFNQNLLGRLGKAVQNVFALSTSLLTAPILAMTALTGQALGTFRVDDTASGLVQVVEVSAGPLAGRALGDLSAERELAVIAHLPAQGGPRFLLDIDPTARVGPDDRLVLAGTPAHVAPLLAGKEGDEEQLRWANWLYRIGRVLRRTLVDVDKAVLICFVVVVVVLSVSTLVLHFGVTKYTVADAFLRSVSVMATGAPLHEEDFVNAPGIRIFVGILRLVGAVLIAAFTAIVTNYLIRARLGGVLEMRRIPESGHVIVVGLGTVGFRVTEELIRLGEKVVVIEKDAANRFVATARQLGAAVMIADASVLEVLRQAHAGTARAVVPATDNDMTNLEVTLLVRELKEGLRVVVLMNEPAFADMLRDAADIRLAVSVPALAAPAFVAGLFGDRVVSVFLIGTKLFAALDLVIQQNDPFVSHALRALAIDYQLLPIALVRQEGPPPKPMLAARLGVGDRVVGIIALSDLERLLSRQPSAAGLAVEVTACPLPTLPWLAGLLRTTLGASAADAERAAAELPLTVAKGLTRGQALDLLAQLERERVTARLVEA